MMDREYRPEEVERRWAEEWAEQGLFTAQPGSGRKPYCMVIPPPNVTGDLHIGHVLVYTLHDIVARWRRMQGRDVLWLPGTDHAGIATQMVVERELAKSNVTRHQLGRREFEKRVWEWKEKYGGRITDALRKLGSSVDWSRERFTLDEGLSRAVRSVFVRLYQEGLIYRDRFIVNWDPVFHSAISDLETEYREVDGKLYTVRYPAATGGSTDITVATTRPETMLGDTAVAVHPDDGRYRDAVGQRVTVPLTGRDVTIIADDFVDPQFGTGAVKITPAHDPNDFEAGRRNQLQELVVIGEDGRMTETAGAAYAGLDRFEARERVVEDLRKAGLLLDVKTHRHAVAHSQRSGAMIEPLLSTQWFVRAKPLAQEAITAIEERRTRFVPDNWSKTYFEWMHNIHDWCISRQLWWGHRIPAWYCDACEKILVAEQTPQACESCGGELRQDDDVLDTWFSSALWPFSTLGWPDQTQDLERYYPTDLLITGHDIIFFWVARMVMLGLKFMDDVPFRDVYIHGLVRDEHGHKMSKSKGNTIVPAEVQERYGTDAVRFTMAILAAPGNDIPLAPERMEGYRAFANKLWNATRFALMKIGDLPPKQWRAEDLSFADRWILSRLEATQLQVTWSMEQYRFDHAADALYHFVWHQFCDWYIELVKPAFQNGSSDTAAAVLQEVLSRLLRLLHPFMPFLTEELWHKLPGAESYIAVAAWPETQPAWRDEKIEGEMELLQELVVRIRNLRSASNIDHSKRVRVLLHCDDSAESALVEAQTGLLCPLVRAEEMQLVEEFPEDLVAAKGVAGKIQIALPLEGLLDLDAERARLEREREKLRQDLDRRTKRLQNDGFVKNAPAEVVQKDRQLRDDLAERVQRLETQIAMLGKGV